MIQLRIKIIDKEELTSWWVTWTVYFEDPDEEELKKDLEYAHEYYEDNEDEMWIADWYLFHK